MKPTRMMLRPLTAAIATVAWVTMASGEQNPGQVESTVGQILQDGHYTRGRIDDRVSKLVLKNLIDTLDYNRLFFTQIDVEALAAKYGTVLDDDILLGNPEPAYEIYDLYKKRMEERGVKIKEMLKEEYKFDSDRKVELNRSELPWAKDEADLDRIWLDRIEGELLHETLNPQKLLTPVAILTKRYDQMLRYSREQTKSDELKTFLSVLALSYDPHNDYMGRTETKDFAINMKLSLGGIGAKLSADEGYTKIMEVVPGGPADKDGRLKVGDRVAAVAQGEQEFIDAVDMKLDKVVEMIRGEKNSMVRLKVIPVDAADPSIQKIVEIKRDEIKLKDQEASAELIERTLADGTVEKLGWITLPLFYADQAHSGQPGAKSTTADVRALINRLKAESITGLVMDLRLNGGGSLDEAIDLTGLFIKDGPVVQVKDARGGIQVLSDKNPAVAYDGPMVVLTNRLSASASEIFSAALQDYNRAVVVGDSSTFGKGTVQMVVDVARFLPGWQPGDAGTVKLTIQKFYRVAGGSTQLKGVVPDVKLPSLFDQSEIGESALKGPMPYDTVPAVAIGKLEKPLFQAELSQRSAARIAAAPEFGYIKEDLALGKKRTTENAISLNLEKRRAEIAAEKARKEKREGERAGRALVEPKRYALTLDTLEAKELPLVTGDKKKKKPEPEEGAEANKETKPVGDVVKNETLQILSDLIELAHGGKAPEVVKAPVPEIVPAPEVSPAPEKATAQ
jgi:carboxyl-terminal processing protease